MVERESGTFGSWLDKGLGAGMTWLVGLTGLTALSIPLLRTVAALGELSGAQLFSLPKEKFRALSPEEGARVYSQIMVQRSLLEVSRNCRPKARAGEGAEDPDAPVLISTPPSSRTKRTCLNWRQ